MTEDLSYKINKGINRPLEFRGLKGQYVYILAIGLASLLVGFTILYLIGLPLYLCLPVVLIVGSGLFVGVYRLSHRYGEHGLMKAQAHRRVPTFIKFRNRSLLTSLAPNKG